MVNFEGGSVMLAALMLGQMTNMTNISSGKRLVVVYTEL